MFNAEQGSSTEHDVHDTLLKLFALKVERNCSAETVTDFLSFLRGLHGLLDEDVRSSLPSSFKAMITALLMFGFPCQDVWEYDMCSCSTIYR